MGWWFCMIKKMPLLLVSILLLCLLAGCGSVLSHSEVAKYADDVTEQMLLAYNDDSYENYIENTSNQFKEAVSEEKMKEGNAMVRGKIGTYVPDSKQFKDASKGKQDGQKFIAVRYKGKFTGEKDDVIITMIFEDNKTHKVSGIFFNSAKLRE